MNISTVDLNLLRVLDAVLTERSVTRAAARLHVTQSAVSNALARLRRAFDDPLFTRTRGGLVPSARALALQPPLREALASLEALSRSPGFDLATSQREWRIAFAEHYGPLVLPPLMAQLRREAPHTTLHVVTVDEMLASNGLASGEVDLHLGLPGSRPRAWRSAPLFSDQLVCILRKGHPAARKALTVDAFVALPQVQGHVVAGRGREVDDALAARGLARRVVLHVPYYGAIFPVVASSDCIATVSRRQAEYVARSLPLKILPHPLALPDIEVSMNWHVRSDKDPSLAALRQMIHGLFNAETAT